MKMSSRKSICWDCANARAHLCPWIAQGKKVWKRGTRYKRKSVAKSKEYISVYIVHECQHFKPDEEQKRKAIGW